MEVFIIKKNGKNCAMALKTDINITEYNKLVKECEEAQKQEAKEKEKLIKRLEDAENEIKKLKHEIAIDRGECEE